MILSIKNHSFKNNKLILEVFKNNKLNPLSSKVINLTSSPENEQIKLHSFKREIFF